MKTSIKFTIEELHELLITIANAKRYNQRIISIQQRITEILELPVEHNVTVANMGRPSPSWNTKRVLAKLIEREEAPF